MKKLVSLQPLIFLLLASSLTARELPQTSPAKAGLSEVQLGEVARFMERQVADQKIAGGIVAVSHRGKIGFLHCYGQMDREANKPMQSDTIFRIYSMSSAITTAAALTLYEKGQLGLDDPVSEYIPSFAMLHVATTNGLRRPVRPVTIRDLVLHTCGMSYGTDGPDALKEAYARLKPMESTNLAEMAERLSQVPLTVARPKD